MLALCWNVRGLGNPRAVRALGDLLRERRPNLVFLIETRKTVDQIEVVMRKLGGMYRCFKVNRGRTGGGGIALLWRDTGGFIFLRRLPDTLTLMSHLKNIFHADSQDFMAIQITIIEMPLLGASSKVSI